MDLHIIELVRVLRVIYVWNISCIWFHLYRIIFHGISTNSLGDFEGDISFSSYLFSNVEREREMAKKRRRGRRRNLVLIVFN